MSFLHDCAVGMVRGEGLEADDTHETEYDRPVGEGFVHLTGSTLKWRGKMLTFHEHHTLSDCFAIFLVRNTISISGRVAKPYMPTGLPIVELSVPR